MGTPNMGQTGLCVNREPFTNLWPLWNKITKIYFKTALNPRSRSHQGQTICTIHIKINSKKKTKQNKVSIKHEETHRRELSISFVWLLLHITQGIYFPFHKYYKSTPYSSRGRIEKYWLLYKSFLCYDYKMYAIVDSAPMNAFFPPFFTSTRRNNRFDTTIHRYCVLIISHNQRRKNLMDY